MSNPTDLTPSDIAAWYKQQIKKYQRLLAMHEAEFPATSPGRNGHSETSSQALPKLGAVDAAKIRAYVTDHHGRVGDLAKHFNVDPQTIRDIIADSANGLSDKDRGWVRVIGGHAVFEKEENR